MRKTVYLMTAAGVAALLTAVLWGVVRRESWQTADRVAFGDGRPPQGGSRASTTEEWGVLGYRTVYGHRDWFHRPWPWQGESTRAASP